MNEMALLRIGILAAGLLLVVAIFFFGRPQKPAQGRRKSDRTLPGMEPKNASREAVDDVADRALINSGDAVQSELPLDVRSADNVQELGKRPRKEFDKLVTLFVAARPEQMLRGEDIVVAAEKTGMVFGHMQIFHRLLDGKPELGPVFSMASILKPGNFEMESIGEMETPAIAFFLTLPGPLGALEAWEKMEPTVTRMAELLDAVVLDDSRNALGRQRIAHIRDELRAYDREHSSDAVAGKSPRW